MTGDLIKSFLVGLGFDIDEKSLAKFNKSVSDSTLKVIAMAGAIEASAVAIGYGIEAVSKDFEALGYQYRLITPAINKAIILRRELFSAYARAGVNLQDVIVKSVKLNMSLTKTRYAFQALYQGVASRFFDLLAKQSDLFRKKIYANMPKIQKILENVVKAVFKAFEVVSILGARLWSILGRVYDFFVKLDEVTGGWSTRILAVIAAWKLLNLEFLATPLGLLITGLAALLALYDDFRTYQEGGESFFDWAKYIPTIDLVADAMKKVYGWLKGIGEALGDIAAAVTLAFSGKFAGAFEALKAIGGNGDDFLNNLTRNSQTTPLGIPYANPVAHSSLSNLANNYNATSQTTIYTQPGADVNALGKEIGNQYKINFDRVVNMGGSFSPGGVTKPQ